MREYLKEMFKRKDLLIYLVRSGLKAEHRNSYLGYFWWLLDPLLNVAIYYFLMGVLLGRANSVENFAVFLVIGLVGWRWMNTSINSSSRSITKYRSIINQVYLPKSIFPIATTLTQTFNFVFGLAIVGIFLIIFGVTPGWQVIYLPLIILVQFIFLLAISLFVSYITVFIRDIDNVLSHILRVFFYASPIIWEGSRFLKAESLQNFTWLLTYNPVAIILDSYRAVLMWRENPQFAGLFVILILSLAAIFLMIRHYSKNEHKIIKAL